jgi:cytochrome c peroxidase
MLAAVAAAALFAAAATAARLSAEGHEWTDAERAMLRSLSIDSLGPVPAEPTNAHADDPSAASFGHSLFFDSRFSSNGEVSCATCHQPSKRFTDGLPKAKGVGQAKRNSPSVVAAAYSPWMFWDGRRDSLWSQALGPLEDPNEHGTSRDQVVALVAKDPVYRNAYESVFGPLPELSAAGAVDRVFANVGKAIGAYERLLRPGPSRFDAYVEAVLDGDAEAQARLFSADEIEGLRIYLNEGQCTQCHNGPLLTNNEFHNTGVISAPGDVPDKGRVDGVRQVLETPFNCLGPFSDAERDDCVELEFVATGPHLVGAMRTPSLRNLEGTEPYMHQGQLATLADVLRHYNDAPPAMIGHSELVPLGLDKRQLGQLEAFLGTLAAPIAADAKWLAPPARGSE